MGGPFFLEPEHHTQPYCFLSSSKRIVAIFQISLCHLHFFKIRDKKILKRRFLKADALRDDKINCQGNSSFKSVKMRNGPTVGGAGPSFKDDKSRFRDPSIVSSIMISFRLGTAAVFCGSFSNRRGSFSEISECTYAAS